MCLDIDTNLNRTPKIATFPIVVYKALDRYKNRYESPYQAFKYDFGVLYTRKMRKVDSRYIEHGLHACITKEQAAMHMFETHSVMVFGVIPVGAQFYLGHDDEIVSNQMILFKTTAALKKYFGVQKLGTPVERSTL